MHWKRMMDKELLGAWDLDGRDVTVTIESVSGGEVTGNGNKKNKKPIATLRGTTKKLALNATNCKTIEQLSGTPETDKWRGMRITLFGTTTTFGGQTVECIRVRPYPPKGSKGRNGNGRSAPSDRSEADTAAAPTTSEAEPPVIHPRDPDDDVPSDEEAAADA